jgi:hypothetical protein
MAKHALSFLELHNQFFMQGSNLGNKINAAQKGAKLILDDDRSVVWVYFKGKVSFIPTASVASADVIQIPDDVKEALGLDTVQNEPMGPPAIARAKREQFQNVQNNAVPMPDFDPNDMDAVANHREMVRAASANANRPNPFSAQNDFLIQQARGQAEGFKQSAQVSNPTLPTEGQRPRGRPPKILSHADLKAKLDSEAKT